MSLSKTPLEKDALKYALQIPHNSDILPIILVFNVKNIKKVDCPNPTYADKSTRTCVNTCPSGSFYQISGSERICTERCYPSFYADLNR